MIAGLLAARCSDPDESIRRASLQQLTSLRIPSLADVMMPPVEKLLEDVSPAVRSAAVLGVLKVASLVDSDMDLRRFWDKVCCLNPQTCMKQLFNPQTYSTLFIWRGRLSGSVDSVGEASLCHPQNLLL